MKAMIAILSLMLVTSAVSLANPTPVDLKIRIANPTELSKATVTFRQIQAGQTQSAQHIYNGQIVDRETAKNAFLKGETSCRLVLMDETAKISENATASLIMEVPAENRKMLTFMIDKTVDIFGFACQAQTEDVTRESILKTLGSYIEEIK